MEDYDEQQWRNRNRNQGESPVQKTHKNDHAHQCETTDKRTQQSGSNEALDGSNVDGQSTDQIAGILAVVVGERKPLDVGIQCLSEIVHHLIANRGRQVSFR